MSASHPKVDCQVCFMRDGDPSSKSQTFGGLLHLFEHRYDEKIAFWYGVADVAIDAATYFRMFSGNPANLRVVFELEDGRKGSARWLGEASASEEPPATIYRFGVVGITPLSAPSSSALIGRAD